MLAHVLPLAADCVHDGVCVADPPADTWHCVRPCVCHGTRAGSLRALFGTCVRMLFCMRVRVYTCVCVCVCVWAGCVSCCGTCAHIMRACTQTCDKVCHSMRAWCLARAIEIGHIILLQVHLLERTRASDGVAQVATAQRVHSWQGLAVAAGPVLATGVGPLCTAMFPRAHCHCHCHWQPGSNK